MDLERIVGELYGVKAQLQRLHSTDTAEFVSWHSRVRSLLTHSLGDDHHVTRDFVKIRWTVSKHEDLVVEDDEAQAEWDQLQKGARMADGLLEAAIYELEMLRADAPTTDETGIDPELWAHIAPEVQAQAWGKVVLNAAVFTEQRIRTWAGRSGAEFGKNLAVKVFGDSGEFRMGRTDSEKQGWQMLAVGFAQAVRNRDAHNIQDRPDLKRYALSAVGTCSLLLTQMRYEHGNRFADDSPVNPHSAD